jgi:hypothetical protein
VQLVLSLFSSPNSLPSQLHALGRKVSDEFTVPLCRGHHREVHRCGDEAAWWRNAGVDVIVTARALWLDTHPLPVAPAKMTINETTSGADIFNHQNEVKGVGNNERITKRSQLRKTLANELT